ncbi:AIR synthase related protein, partial [Candidatus Acetothermia bacterium]|nr:AIR synthase related protein [Candidatus Acetothermia bacterium]
MKKFKEQRPGGEATQQAVDLCSQIAYRAATATFIFRKGRFGEPVDFYDGTSGPIHFDGADGYLVKNSDGVGSKVLIAQRLGRHNTVAHDLIAMVADDAAAIGAEPFAATNSLDVAIADPQLVTELFSGLVDSCRIARIAMVGGEIAQLPEQVCGQSDLPYIWNADLVGIASKEKLLDGTKVKPESAIIAVASYGIRSNGLTLAQAILKERFGVDWVQQRFDKTTWGEKLLTPSLILTPFLVDLWSGYRSEPRAQVEGI